MQHRMQHRTAISAIVAAALIVGACSDQAGGNPLSTEPATAPPAATYVTTTSVAIVNPKTHRLETVTTHTAPAGVSASIAGGTTTYNGMQVFPNEPGVAPVAGHGSWTFTDTLKRVQNLVFLYRTGGGPPAAMQHYTNGVLVSTTAFVWGKTTQGWVRTRSYMQSVRNGSLVGTYTTVTSIAPSGTGTTPVQPVRFDRPPVVGPVQHALGTVAYALAFAFAPRDATAQFYFYDCRQEWLRYAGAAALIAGAGAALAAAPELTPVLLTGFIAALATAGAMEDVLIDCMLAHESVASGGFGTGGFSFGGGGGGTGSGSAGDTDCLEGSYAAHCTTPFTL